MTQGHRLLFFVRPGAATGRSENERQTDPNRNELRICLLWIRIPGTSNEVFALKIMGKAVRVSSNTVHKSKPNRLAYLPNILGIGKLRIDFEINVRGIMASI